MTSPRPAGYVLGPLTTTFSRPSSCTTLFGWNHGADLGMLVAGTSASQAQSCVSSIATTAVPIVLGDDVACWPPATVAPPAPTGTGSSVMYRSLNGWGFYSPGLVCPIGYTTACTQILFNDGSESTFTQGVGFAFQFTPLIGETAVGCCPS